MFLRFALVAIQPVRAADTHDTGDFAAADWMLGLEGAGWPCGGAQQNQQRETRHSPGMSLPSAGITDTVRFGRHVETPARPSHFRGNFG